MTLASRTETTDLIMPIRLNIQSLENNPFIINTIPYPYKNQIHTKCSCGLPDEGGKPPPPSCPAAPALRFAAGQTHYKEQIRTSNIEHSTSNIEYKEQTHTKCSCGLPEQSEGSRSPTSCSAAPALRFAAGQTHYISPIQKQNNP